MGATKGIEGGVDPRKADSPGDGAAPGVVVALDVVCVFEVEPFVRREQGE
jgi:hypothetical protein